MKKILILIAVVAIGTFAWWTISPLFIDKVVEDELDPEIAALLESDAAADTDVATGQTFTLTTNNINSAESSETDLELDVESNVLPTEVNTVPADPVVTETVEPIGPVVRGPFPIQDTPGHPATGNIRVIETAEQTLVRYENYDGTNGPDLKVWLTNDLGEANNFVSLGEARGNQGNINYEVPDGVDVDDFKYVVTWCEAFGVLFDYAEIK